MLSLYIIVPQQQHKSKEFHLKSKEITLLYSTAVNDNLFN